MEYVKHLDILGIETSLIPCIELHGAPNSATKGVVGLLGLDVDSDGKEVYVCTAVNGAIYTWKCIKDGKDGVCVRKSEINDKGELILTLSDGTTLNSGVVKGVNGKDGKDGESGPQGVGISKAYINAGGALSFELTDGRTIYTSERVVGDDGKDGIGITKVELTPNVELVVTLSNNTVINLGSVKPNHTATADTTSGITELNKDDVMRMFVGSTDEWNDYDGSKNNVVAVFTDEDCVYPYKQRLWSDSSNQIRSGETLTVGNISNQLKIGDCLELKYTITYQDGVIYHCRANCYVSYVYSSGVKVIETDNFFTNSVELVCDCPNSSGFRMVALIDNEDISYITLTDIYKIVE